LDGASYVPLSTSELQFHIGDYDSDLMSYSVTTYPDVGGGNGNMKPDGTYTIPVSGLKSSTEYSWYVTVSDGKDTVEAEFTFTTEAVAPIVTEVTPENGERYVPIMQGYLRFHLRDPQNDLMSYTVETSPFIGSGSGSGVGAGDISVPISGLDVMTEYRWFVNVTDGVNPTSEVFWFQTEPLMVFDPFAEGWAYRKLITVDHTMVVGDLEHFPVLLSLTDMDLRDKAQDDGDDILFMDGAGVATRLYHEIEEFDDSTGRLIAWVNVSSLSSTVDNSFYMYYGNMDSDDQQCPEKTWDSHYIMVQHMNGASYNLMKDSTCNQNDVTSKNDNPLFHSSGKIGYAVGFDGSNDRLHWSTPVRNTFPMSVEIWVESDSPNGPRYAIANGGETGASYGLFLNIENDYLRLGLKDTSNHGMGQYLVPPNPGTWYFCAGTWQGNLYNATFYVDDTIFSGTPVSIQYGGARNLQLGASTANQYYWDGVVDEIRISDIIRSEEWILTGYNNQNSPSDFLSIGSEEPHP
jgi:hypothetical protein